MGKLRWVKTASFLQSRSSTPRTLVKGTATIAIENNSNDQQQQHALETAKSFDDIPGFRDVPFFGTSWVVSPLFGKFSLSKLHKLDQEKHRLFGDIVRDQFGSLGIVSCFDPRDIEVIFRNEGKYPSRGEFSGLKAYRESRKQWFSTLGVMLLHGKDWYDLRFKLQKHMLRPKAIERYVEPLHQVARDLTQRLTLIKDEHDEVPDFISELYKWALESVAYIGLDTRLGCLKHNIPPDSEAMKMIRAVHTSFSCINKLEAFNGNVHQLWKWFPTPTWKKFVRTMDFFTETAFKHVNNAMEAFQKGDRKEEKDLTLLQSMLNTKDLDVSAAVTMVIDMLMSGVDTTSHTVAFFLYHLAKNPDKQEKLYEEIISTLPHSTDVLTADKLRTMSYVKYCMKESIRLDPILRGVSRMIDHDMVLSGYKIPAGTIAMGMMQVACRQEKHFKHADQYIPERWMDQDQKPHPFLFIPFGFGIRSCIGRRIAELKILSVVIEVIRKFKLEYHYEDINMLTRLVNIPDRPLRLNFKQRTHR